MLTLPESFLFSKGHFIKTFANSLALLNNFIPDRNHFSKSYLVNSLIIIFSKFRENTPKPRIGISTPLFKVTYSTLSPKTN